jgi:hypothetical protein
MALRCSFALRNPAPGPYLQIAESRREGTKIKQRVVATLGRLDELQGSGQLESLLHSGTRFAQRVMLLWAHPKGAWPVVRTRRIGASLIFDRLWEQTGCRAVIESRLARAAF